MLLGKLCKQPAETVDFGTYYQDFFDAGMDSDTISTHTVTNVRTQIGSTAAAASLISTGIITNPEIWVMLSGGLVGEIYVVTVTMTSTIGRILQDEVIVTIKEI